METQALITNKVLTIKKIQKNFQEKSVLKPLSFSICEGETLAIIGPSGAGKTTLLNILANTVSPDAGDVFYEDTNYNELKSKKDFAKKIGIIRQQYDLVQELPVIQNVLIGNLNRWSLSKSLLSLIIPQDKKKAQEALVKVGLQDMLDQNVKSLSGGEQQRVAIARMLLQDPKIILADEPVSALDPARAKEILELLSFLAKENNKTLITVLHSTHYAQNYFDRIIGIKNGEIEFDLPSSKVTKEMLKSLYAIKGTKDEQI